MIVEEFDELWDFYNLLEKTHIDAQKESNWKHPPTPKKLSQIQNGDKKKSISLGG